MTSCTNAGIMKASENCGKNHDLMPHVQLPRNNKDSVFTFEGPDRRWFMKSDKTRVHVRGSQWVSRKHPVWVWKGSVWITYHLHIWNGSKAGDKDVGLDFCDWTYGTRESSSVLMQKTATFSPYVKKVRTRNPQFMHDLYAFKKGLKNKINDLTVGYTLIVWYYFLEKIANITENVTITVEKRSIRSYESQSWPSVKQTVDSK